MWERFRKKIERLIWEEVEVDVEEEVTYARHHDPSPVKAKVAYKYPDKKNFQFPLTVDRYDQKNNVDIPAYQRRGTDRHLQVQEDQINHLTSKMNKIEKKEMDRPFTPSKVASPIYGYHKRKETIEVETIPAYKRKQERKNKAKIEAIKDDHIQTKTQLESSNAIQQKEEDFMRTEHINDEVAIAIEEQVHTHKSSRLTNTDNDKIINQNVSQRKVEKKKTNKLESKIPINVMMTPWDKMKLRKKQERSEPVHSEQAEQDSLPLYLLNDQEQKDYRNDKWIQEQTLLLEKTLQYFKVRAKVVTATQGPSVTRFEVKPELGVKVSKIRNLSDDLKLNMSAKDIRIEAPIPGKNTVGIEIPNLISRTVHLQEIFEHDSFKKSTSPLTIALGLDIEGSPVTTNIQKMPHGLIAGATGSGKSVCINAILISMLYKAHYDDVKFLLIDPKMVELAPYNGIPHLISPVITDVKAATAALKWAVNEMEERYNQFVQESVRDIKRFNQKMLKQNRTDEKMPFIVIIIDELADLMMVSPQDVEDSICRIAQKARACGIHLLLATQRPSVDVITGLIKANIPTRIAFSVSSQVDSRTIIDHAGAEKLLGKGDMLFLENGSGKSVRLQGPFVSDEEIERVTSYVRSLAEPNYLFEQETLLEQITFEEEEDELLLEAIHFVIDQNSASTSLLQRHFRIGYNRAARLIDTMEERGLISQQNGSKPRDVLVTKSQYEQASQN